MSTEQFTTQDFEKLLTGLVDPAHITRENVKGEVVYTLNVYHAATNQVTNKRIVVRSSINPVTGIAASTGGDSIRCWVEYQYKNKWLALGKDDVKLTQRRPGWQERLTLRLRELWKMALDDSKKEAAVTAPKTMAQIDNGYETEPVLCPKCQAPMILRSRKSDGAKFYGCSTFPRCKGIKPYIVAEEEHAARDWTKFTPSIYQLAIKDALLSDTGNFIIEAGPGSGKTTLLEWLVQFVDTNASPDVAFWAFNKKIVTELRKRLPGSSFSITTTHSAGRSNAAASLGKIQLVTRKLYNLLRDYGEKLDAETYKLVDENINSVTKLVSLLKATMLEPTEINMDFICDRWHIETNGARDEVYAATKWLYAKSIETAMAGILDFDDMIYLSASNRVPCKKYDLIFVDETQDLNAAQIAMLLNSIKPNGRVFVVGDAWQSIYGFRGADTEAMDNVKTALNASALPLSVTYRCPASHVDYINERFPDASIQAAPNAKEGFIGSISDYEFETTIKDGDLVLCRCNAPLVGPAFRLLRRGIKAVILGRDIGSNLRSLVSKVQKKYNVYSLGDTLAHLVEYEQVEVAKLMRMKKAMRAETLADKVATIIALADGCETVRELESKIDTIFAEDAEGVTFSSVHKAKGGEADRVFILEPRLMPHPLATTEWEQKQEKNVLYVALSRSKSELFFVN